MAGKLAPESPAEIMRRVLALPKGMLMGCDLDDPAPGRDGQPLAPVRLRRRLAVALAGVAVGAGAWSAQSAALASRPDQVACDASDERHYLAENDAAMHKMMTGMDAKPTGDVDRDFVDMMVPHHQGAIDMAVAVLRYGRNPMVRRLAQEIIVDQQQEIAAMRRAVGEPAPASAPAPTAPERPSPMPDMDMR